MDVAMWSSKYIPAQRAQQGNENRNRNISHLTVSFKPLFQLRTLLKNIENQDKKTNKYKNCEIPKDWKGDRGTKNWHFHVFTEYQSR